MFWRQIRLFVELTFKSLNFISNFFFKNFWHKTNAFNEYLACFLLIQSGPCVRGRREGGWFLWGVSGGS